MQIFGPFRVSTTQAAGGPQRLAGQQQPPSPAGPKPSAGPVDQLDLSAAASGAERLSGGSPIAGNGEIRIDRVAELRRQIADGSYETSEKLDAALDRLLDEIA
jgi:anti-sigma28 factor (negative regulator of flagellin synthesis)